MIIQVLKLILILLFQHVHLSDNYGIDVTNTTYARFRLRPSNPDLAGLTPHLNETYTYDEFIGFQGHCAARGVTVSAQACNPLHILRAQPHKTVPP